MEEDTALHQSHELRLELQELNPGPQYDIVIAAVPRALR